MTREIKFRAKTIDGTWFYWKLTDPIDMGSMFEAIDWKTLGQSTVLLDKNGKEIYEGDIVAIEWGKDDDTKYEELVVEFVNGMFLPMALELSESFEIIGNIYQNPELIK